MPRFLNTTGQPTLGIAICSRCQTKRMLAELVEDGNIKNFYVCSPDLYPGRGCWDNYDPFRYPAPPPDDLRLPFIRPDVALLPTAAQSAQLPVEPPVLPNVPPVPPPIPNLLIFLNSSGGVLTFGNSPDNHALLFFIPPGP